MEQIECQVLSFKWQRTSFHFKGGYNRLWLNRSLTESSETQVMSWIYLAEFFLGTQDIRLVCVQPWLTHRWDQILYLYPATAMDSNTWVHVVHNYSKHAKSGTFFVNEVLVLISTSQVHVYTAAKLLLKDIFSTLSPPARWLSLVRVWHPHANWLCILTSHRCAHVKVDSFSILMGFCSEVV